MPNIGICTRLAYIRDFGLPALDLLFRKKNYIFLFSLLVVTRHREIEKRSAFCVGISVFTKPQITLVLITIV